MVALRGQQTAIYCTEIQDREMISAANNKAQQQVFSGDTQRSDGCEASMQCFDS